MPTIHVDSFLGIAPKMGPELLPANMAQAAKDANLWSQKLRPLAGLALGELLNKATGDIQTIYRFKGDTWLHWTQDVNVARGAIANDALEKTYYTGTDKPRVTTNALWDDGAPGTSTPPASYILGIPAPDTAPVATDSAGGVVTGTIDYVFTFVRKWSDGTVDEGPPSVPSNVLNPVTRQQSVTLPNGGMTVPGDYGITHKRLYRLNGTFRYFVAEVAIGTTPYVDNIAVTGLGSAISSTFYLGPPDGMIGLIALPNGVFAGFKDNVVYLSEPYRPHAFPLVNQWTMNFPIVAIGNVGTTVVVATTAYPYIGSGVDPAAYSFRRDTGLYPCVSKRSMASSDLGVLWATATGVAVCDGNSVSLGTKPFLTRKEWREQFFPTTLHGTVHDGRYYAWFYNGTVDDQNTKLGGGLILDWSERAFLTTLSRYAYAAHTIPDSDDLWLCTKNRLNAAKNYTYQWEADPTNPFAYEWKSKRFVIPGRDNFGWCQIIANYGEGLSSAEIAALAAQIAAVIAFNQAQGDTDGPINGNAVYTTGGWAMNDGPMGGDNTLQIAPSSAYVTGEVSFKYWVDDDLKLELSVTSNEPFPLPAGFTGEIHEFQISGGVETTQVTLATTVEELAAV